VSTIPEKPLQDKADIRTEVNGACPKIYPDVPIAMNSWSCGSHVMKADGIILYFCAKTMNAPISFMVERRSVRITGRISLIVSVTILRQDERYQS
jgi:hypothetical protein